MSLLRIFFALVVCVFLLWIISLLKKRKLNLRYTLTWLFAAIALLIVDLFPQIISKTMKWIGIATPVNMVFVLEAVFVLIILLSLTVIVSHLTEKVCRLTQTIAILEKRLREFEDNSIEKNEEI